MKSVYCMLVMLALALPALASPVKGPVKVELRKLPGGWQLLRGGQPYYVQGAGGGGPMQLLHDMGGNSVRTWGPEPKMLQRVLPEAERLGMTVTVGLVLEHERHGFSYDDAKAVKAQFDRAIAAVEKYRNEPTVLAWGIGNEMEAEGTNPKIWRAINAIAREIHRRDPNHPTMTVIAGPGKDGLKLRQIMRYCPDVDIVGINSYGGMMHLLEDVKNVQLDRPYIVTEFGPVGWWESPRTEWGAPLEQTSTQKAEVYRKAYEHSIKGAGELCLGSYAFVWGAKQERTHTWFGLLVPDANHTFEKTDVVDALAHEWTGKWPANRSPQITSLKSLAAEKTMPAGQTFTATVEATDPEGNALTCLWELREETHDAREGGDAEAVPPAHPESLLKSSGAQAEFRTPNAPGAYRVFLTVHDGHGGVATANFPLQVR